MDPARILAARDHRNALRAAIDANATERQALRDAYHAADRALTDAPTADASRARAVARQALDDNAAERKRLTDALAAAEAELEAAIAGISGPAASAPVMTITTRRDIAKARRDAVEAGAIRALRAAGGRLSNRDLARMLGVSPHGLEPLLKTSTAVRKIHVSYVHPVTNKVRALVAENEATAWVLA